jgi:hypothetical protein
VLTIGQMARLTALVFAAALTELQVAGLIRADCLVAFIAVRS